MVTDTDGYIQIIEYLTEHLSLFESTVTTEKTPTLGTDSIMAVIEIELSEQIISVCSQNESLTFNQRNAIIREVDAILYDLEEIFSGVNNNLASSAQRAFIKEFAGLIKNIFDSVIHSQQSIS